jgi:hypothetical protein
VLKISGSPKGAIASNAVTPKSAAIVFNSLHAITTLRA